MGTFFSGMKTHLDEMLENVNTAPIVFKPIAAKANDVLILRSHEPNASGPAGAQTSEKPREGPGKSRRALPFTEKKKKPETFNKTQNQENTFPCKKCGRVFYKVKSRSAHMKSHAEQEKKAAALRLKEKEAAAAHQQALREESGEGEKG